ncbi:MAG: NAD(P)/FAD-dependent oxidoreductase [Kiloniellaceae bacterium]
MSAKPRFVVIGGGQAAGRAVETMRAVGFRGAITLVAEEPHLPYERPPLSKRVLTGDDPPEKPLIHDQGFYQDRDISLRLGVRAIHIDRQGRAVALADGASLPYDGLLIATGARARLLPVPGADLDGVCYLRTLQDSLEIQRRLRPDARLVIVGGGYIGLEVAASARKRGCQVTVIELMDHVMARVVAPEIGRAFLHYHEAAKVEFRLGVEVQGFAGDAAVTAVLCADGAEVPADLVVVGIGVDPATDLAAKAGLEVDDGIVVDAFGRTSDPSIYAAGDVTNHPNPLLGRRVRLESWQNAQNQAMRVARNMCAEQEPYQEIPWFWSDQYDLNLQMVGLPERWDELVLRGDVGQRKFTAFYVEDGRLVAANTVNNGRDIRPCRQLIAQGRTIDPKVLADPGYPLRDLLRRT